MGTYEILKDMALFIYNYSKRKPRKMPLKKFEKLIEVKAGTKLSRESKIEIIESLIDEGKIRLITSRYGQKYVFMGELV